MSWTVPSSRARRAATSSRLRTVGRRLGCRARTRLSIHGWIELEDVTIEEKDGAQRLSLGGGGDVVVDGEVGEEAIEVVGFELLGMPPVEAKEPVDPAEVGLFGADGVVADPDRAPHLFEEPGCFGASGGGGVGDDVHGVNKT